MYLQRVKKSSFFVACVAFSLIASLLSGCGKKLHVSRDETTNKLVIATLEDPVSFDPRRITYVRDFQYARHLFAGLYNTAEGKNITPHLVKKMEVSPDKRTYTVYLKESVWSDNTPVTSRDFKESWQQALSPDFPCSYYSIFYGIKNAKEIKEEDLDPSELGVETPTDDILILHLNHPIPYFEELMAFPATFPVHKIQRDSGTTPVKNVITNGAFRLKKWEPQSKIVLEKNPLYFDKEFIKLNELEIRIIKNSSTASLMFEKGEIDWLGAPWYDSVLSEAFDQLRKNGKLNHVPLMGTCWIAANVDSPYVSSVKMRQALSMAINRKEVIKQVLKGPQLPAVRVLPFLLDHGEVAYPSLTDQKKAIELFNEALTENGLTKEDFSSLTLCYMASYGSYAQIAELIQKQWGEILGIQIKLQPCEAKLFLDKRSNRKYDLLVGNWTADFDDAQPFLQIFQGLGKGKKYRSSHYSGFKNSTFDALLQKATFSTSISKRKGFLLEAEDILMREMPVFPIFYQVMEYAFNPKIHDMKLSMTGACNFNSAYLEK